MMIDWILPSAGIVCIILCIIYFLTGIRDSNKAMEELKVEKFGITLKLSTIPFILLLLSLILIVPSVYLRYQKIEGLINDANSLKSSLEQKNATIESGKFLIREIQNCTLPVYITLQDIAPGEDPSLDDLQCEILIDKHKRDVVIAKGPIDNQYKILLEQANCNITIEQLEIKDGASRKKWVAENITPCEYVVKNLSIAQRK